MPLVSGSKVCLCTQHPRASPSPASLCHSSGSSPSLLERSRSLGSHSAASTESEIRRGGVTFRPGRQQGVGVLTIDLRKHDPAMISDPKLTLHATVQNQYPAFVTSMVWVVSSVNKCQMITLHRLSPFLCTLYRDKLTKVL